MVYSINEFLEYQANGDIEQGFLFIWDSVGSIGGLKSYNSKVGNNMFDAGTISAAFQDIMDNKIPSSRKISSKALPWGFRLTAWARPVLSKSAKRPAPSLASPWD
jgi:hypothetical protein